MRLPISKYNLHPILHRFKVIVDYWSFFLLSTGVGLPF